MSVHSLSSHQFPETASTEIFNTSWASSSPILWQILQTVYLITLSSSITGMGNTKVQPFYFPSPGSSHALEISEPSKLLIFVNSKCWGAELRNRRGRHGKTKTLCLRSAVWELIFLIFCILASLPKMPRWDICEWSRPKKTNTVFWFDSVIKTLLHYYRLY